MSTRIAIIGLGYVGFPLVVEFGKKNPTLGFDIDTSRIAELNTGFDRTQEVTAEQLKTSPDQETRPMISHRGVVAFSSNGYCIVVIY